MRSPSLTQQTRLDEQKRVVSTYAYKGAQVDVFDSARNALLVIELLGNEEMREWEKAALLPRMLFADLEEAARAAGDDPQALLCHVLWEAFGIDADHARKTEAPVFDWDQDAMRIKASLMSAYGLEWDRAARGMSFADMCGLLGTLMESEQSTPFSEAIKARTAKPPKPNKHNKELRQSIEARKRHFALKAKHADEAKAANDAMADIFAAGKAVARRG